MCCRWKKNLAQLPIIFFSTTQKKTLDFLFRILITWLLQLTQRTPSLIYSPPLAVVKLFYFVRKKDKMPSFGITTGDVQPLIDGLNTIMPSINEIVFYIVISVILATLSFVAIKRVGRYLRGSVQGVFGGRRRRR